MASRRERKTTVAVSDPPSFGLLSLHCTDTQRWPLKGKKREWELGTKMPGATRASLMPLSHQNGKASPVTLTTRHPLTRVFPVHSHRNESSTTAGLCEHLEQSLALSKQSRTAGSGGAAIHLFSRGTWRTHPNPHRLPEAAQTPRHDTHGKSLEHAGSV